ncbi:MAG: alanine--tRNA ligase-related protein, partial [Oscillospiraceae bacterium]|nr:alanine--tRNA ligase-related protein [Oscillospiraceae bacterium]
MTEDMAEEAGMSVDEAGFQELMEQQRQRAREARGDMSEAWQGLDLGLDNTPTEFTGYEKTEDTGEILAMVLGGELTHEISTGAEAVL